MHICDLILLNIIYVLEHIIFIKLHCNHENCLCTTNRLINYHHHFLIHFEKFYFILFIQEKNLLYLTFWFICLSYFIKILIIIHLMNFNYWNYFGHLQKYWLYLIINYCYMKASFSISCILYSFQHFYFFLTFFF